MSLALTVINARGGQSSKPASVPNPQPSGGSGRLHGTILRDARRMQRKGLTLSEIAEELDCRRSAVERMLYWEVVNAER